MNKFLKLLRANQRGNMLIHQGITMKIEIKKDAVLKALHANREQHAKIVAEANAGYIKRATLALEAKLGELTAGKPSPLDFESIERPISFLDDYDTIIGTLGAHQGETITIGPDEYRQFVQGKWTWDEHFLRGNAVYSATARAMR